MTELSENFLNQDPAISEFMNRTVLSGSAQTPLPAVIAQMYEHEVSAFIVCESGVPIGVITEKDAVEVLHTVMLGNSIDHLTAQSVMATPIQTLPETATMSEVIEMMKTRYFRRVPITDESNRLCGIVNLVELQAAMNNVLERRGKDLEAAVEARTAELKEANQRLEELSVRDGLTGLLNRRAMVDCLQSAHALAARYGNPYATILCDIDHFKNLNDTAGHLEGDRVLKKVAETVAAAVRVSDTVYRYGGEEFLVVLPETDISGAVGVAERMRLDVEALAEPHPASDTSDCVTVSFGVSETRVNRGDPLDTWQHMVERADEALYRAKRAGRNCVVSSEDDE